MDWSSRAGISARKSPALALWRERQQLRALTPELAPLGKRKFRTARSSGSSRGFPLAVWSRLLLPVAVQSLQLPAESLQGCRGRRNRLAVEGFPQGGGEPRVKGRLLGGETGGRGGQGGLVHREACGVQDSPEHLDPADGPGAVPAGRQCAAGREAFHRDRQKGGDVGGQARLLPEPVLEDALLVLAAGPIDHQRQQLAGGIHPVSVFFPAPGTERHH